MLAERLFEYPLRGGSVSLLPDSTLTSKFGFDEIYHHLNLKIPGNQIHNSIEFIRHGKGINKQAADYILCGYLMDKNLDAFVENITKYYDINDFLPKHYREALTLYVHSHTTPKVIFKNSIMDADFQDYQIWNTISQILKNVRTNFAIRMEIHIGIITNMLFPDCL